MGGVVESCPFRATTTGTPGTACKNDNPRVTGWQDFDYTDAVIARVQSSVLETASRLLPSVLGVCYEEGVLRMKFPGLIVA